nr:DUF3251 domain-containing protein [Pantoea sp. 201603H]
MVKYRLPLSMLAAIILLAGCASQPQQTKVNELHNEVSKLNQQMRKLVTQASALEQQGQLNANSARGAWLLPRANTGVVLQSDIGDLRLSLNYVEAEANGTRAILHIRANDERMLPAFTAKVEWGELDPTTGKPLTVDSQSQTIEVPSSLLAKTEATVPLRLSGIAPDQLGFVRVHDLMAVAKPSAQ